MKPTPLVVAHRGLTRGHTENTIPALRAAAEFGVDMVEFDIHETHDHEFVVFHNGRPAPTAPRWNAIDYADAQKYLKNPTLAPRLSDCLRALGNLPVYLEPKKISHFACLISYLKSHPLAPGSVIGSSDKKLLTDLHAGNAPYPLLLSVHPKTSHVFYFAGGILMGRMPTKETWDFLAGFSLHHSIAMRRFIAALLERGKLVYVWTVNQKKRMVELRAQGVQAIITDRPEVLKSVAGQ